MIRQLIAEGAQKEALVMADTRPAPTITHLLALAQKKGFAGRRTTSWRELMQVWNEASDEERDQVIAEALKRKRP